MALPISFSLSFRTYFFKGFSCEETAAYFTLRIGNIANARKGGVKSHKIAAKAYFCFRKPHLEFVHGGITGTSLVWAHDNSVRSTCTNVWRNNKISQPASAARSGAVTVAAVMSVEEERKKIGQ